MEQYTEYSIVIFIMGEAGRSYSFTLASWVGIMVLLSLPWVRRGSAIPLPWPQGG